MTAREFKLGRRPPRPESEAPRLKLAEFLTGVVPDHPAATDYLAELANWQVLGNDRYGDCVSVTWANIRRLVTAYLTSESYPTLAQVLALYKTQNPNFPEQDDGMVIQDCLSYLTKHSGPDGAKALGFAQVDVNNVAEVQAAIAIFGSVWVGVNVQDAQLDQFDAGQPWDYVAGSPVEGGHSVIVGGYGKGGKGVLGGDEKFITWAKETSFTDTFWAHEAEEAWVVIWPEMLDDTNFLAGVDLVAFAAAYKAITGRDFPAVVTPPTPTPTPPPVPDKPDFWDDLMDDLEKLLVWLRGLFG